MAKMNVYQAFGIAGIITLLIILAGASGVGYGIYKIVKAFL